MTSEELEVEVKLSVDPGWKMPDLTAAEGVASVGDPVEHLLEATYLDTADLRLVRARTSLRHRTGDEHAGWHLKLPVGDDRREIRAEDSPTLPPELAGLVRARTRGCDLVPVARLRTRRLSRRLAGADGTPLVEVTDDSVTAEVPAAAAGEAAEVLTWREVEVELVDGSGDRSVLDAVTAVLVDSGAAKASGGSKVGRALAGRLKRLAVAAPPAPGPSVPAGLVVLGYVATQVERITAADPAVRRDEPDAVHSMRVGTRRLRSVLASFRSLVDRSATEPLRGELAWLAGVLGAARDAEVLRAHLLELVAEEPEELARGPVAARLDAELGGRYRDAHADVVRVLDGERYLRLLRDLDALVVAGAVTGRGSRPAKKELDRRLAKEWRRVEDRVAAALAAGAGDRAGTGDGAAGEGAAGEGAAGDGEALHEARKAAKRTRYAAELASAVLGDRAEQLADELSTVQDALGAHQDGVLARQQLLASAEAAQQAGEDGLPYGRLHAIEEARARSAVHELKALWRTARQTAKPWR
jgi:CHAD domain-containing protein